MEKLEHFGIIISSKNQNFKLTRNEYLKVSDKVTTASLADLIFDHSYFEILPKDFMVDYLEKLLDYYRDISWLDMSEKQSRFEHLAGVVLKKFKQGKVKQITSDEEAKIKLNKILDTFDLKSSIEGKIYSKTWLDKKLNEVTANYDINMNFFASLKQEEFDATLNQFLSINKGFKQILDLNDCMNKTGCYLMILGEYKQVYIGRADDIGKRIKEHWQKKRSFDRLVFGDVYSSKLSIDSFKALDTTQIFIYQANREKSSLLEEKFVSYYPSRYSLNRIPGGEFAYKF